MILHNTILVIALLSLSTSKSFTQTDKISLTLQVKDTINKLPAIKKDWFTVIFICSIKNNSDDTLYFVDPEAYKIFPHPWIISVNGVGSRFWPGDIGCAPSFSSKDIVKLATHSFITKQFDWNIYHVNFSKDTGTYSAKVRYNYNDTNTFTVGVSKKPLTNLKSEYSNSVTFKIVEHPQPTWVLNKWHDE